MAEREAGVYFALVGRHLKIGFSKDVLRRAVSLRKGRKRVEMFGYIPVEGEDDQPRMDMERAILERFRPFRSHGREWHALTSECLNEMEQCFAEYHGKKIEPRDDASKMGRKPLDPDARKSVNLVVRLTPPQMAQVTQEAAAKGFTQLAAYVRHKLAVDPC